VPIEEIRAKDGNQSIPLFISMESGLVREDPDAYSAYSALPDALLAYLKSSQAVRTALPGLMACPENWVTHGLSL
jgi:hypothetical protein